MEAQRDGRDANLSTFPEARGGGGGGSWGARLGRDCRRDFPWPHRRHSQRGSEEEHAARAARSPGLFFRQVSEAETRPRQSEAAPSWPQAACASPASREAARDFLLLPSFPPPPLPRNAKSPGGGQERAGAATPTSPSLISAAAAPVEHEAIRAQPPPLRRAAPRRPRLWRGSPPLSSPRRCRPFFFPWCHAWVCRTPPSSGSRRRR